MKYITHSALETQKLATKSALKYKEGGIFTLSGNLGAGKTTFAQGFAKGLGIKTKIISPTFTLIKEYNLPFKTYAKFFHIDLYRLENDRQIENLGLSDIFSNPENIVLIEWAEKLTNLPKNKAINIVFEFLSEFKRKITIID